MSKNVLLGKRTPFHALSDANIRQPFIRKQGLFRVDEKQYDYGNATMRQSVLWKNSNRRPYCSGTLVKSYPMQLCESKQNRFSQLCGKQYGCDTASYDTHQRYLILIFSHSSSENNTILCIVMDFFSYCRVYNVLHQHQKMVQTPLHALLVTH